MNSIRRAAVRSAFAVSRQLAPKAPTAPIASKIARSARPIAINAARYFSQSARALNVEEDASTQRAEGAVTQQNAREARDALPQHIAFVRNLIFDATEEHIKTAFEKYGEVTNVNIARDPRGLSKGYAFVYFATAEALQDACRNVDGSFWHGRRINCEPKKSSGSGRVPRLSEPSSTLYIGNIPYETTDAELNRVFRDVDNLTDIRIAVDRTTGWPRGFAHADFTTVEAAVDAFNKLKDVTIGDRILTIDYSAGFKKGDRKPREGREPREGSGEIANFD